MNYKLESKTLLLWRIRVGAAALAAALIFVLLCKYSLYFLIPAAMFLCAGVAAVFWYLPAFFGGYSIFVGENAVIVTRGVIIKTSHIMPFRRLVFAGSYSTPLSKFLGLKGVTLRAARASLLIPEIGSDAADRLIYGISGESDYD